MATPEILDLSAQVIDSGSTAGVVGPLNRVTNELSELDDGLAVVESFSHCVAFATDEGLVCFDASGPFTGTQVRAALRSWRPDAVSTLVYTHGHLDHVGGSGAFVADADAHGARRPQVVGHEAVKARLDRYRRTDGWNRAINARQFGGISRSAGLGIGARDRFLPDDAAEPTLTYTDRTSLRVGGLDVELRHARGETDDHTWAWIPSRRAICSGDFVIWNFPNAGNPQKVQRYPEEWAAALRQMDALESELLLPAHGLAVRGRERIHTVLDETATVLEQLVADVLEAMNAGLPLDEVVQTVRVDPDLLERPWLRPLYDEPEFAIRNVWRQYGGWWDGDAASLKPAPAAALAEELASLVGGPTRLAERAQAAGCQERSAPGLSLGRDGRPSCAGRRCHPRGAARHLPPASGRGALLDGQGDLRRRGSRVRRGRRRAGQEVIGSRTNTGMTRSVLSW